MKKIIKYIALLLLFVPFTSGFAQPGLQVIPRIGYDIPFFKNNTPYIKYKGGMDAGLSVDYYWQHWGFGADVDYIKNKPKSSYPTAGLINAASVSLSSFSVTENPVTRFFYGIGPGYRYQQPSGKLTYELNGRIGLASIKGGRTELRETTTSVKELLNFHAGYKAKNVLSAKAQIRGTYFFKPNIGFSIGAYYLHHFNVPELTDPALGFSAKYLQPVAAISGTQQTGNAYIRSKPCNCGVSSAGMYAGLVVKLGKKKKEEKCLPEYALAVTARDKYTGELLPETQVVVKNTKGEIVQTGVTNNFGVVVFEKMMPEDYAITGTLAKVQLDNAHATKNEFLKNKNKVVQKQVIFGSRNFIVKGKIVECNSSKGIPNISVVIGKVDLSYLDMTLSKEDGSFLMQIPDAEGDYSLYGKKENYYSQVEVVNPSDYNRDKTLFIKLELCAEKVECGKAILLKNILFDLDKYTIKEEAKKELNKLVQFMKDNPSVKVELSSHTDCRASYEYNETLSQNRANASVDYIVSQGINRDRLIGKGYGETRLLNKCADGISCSEAEHAVNRRTEMKVICNK